jgi:nucleotide-binding universal stress UspA family protein
MTILVGYDGTPESTAALAQAARTASAHGSRLHVVTCLEHDAGESPTRARRELDAGDAAAEALDEIAGRLGGDGLEVTTELRHALTGDAARSILEAADDHDTELIVLGFEPKARLEEMVLGSVAREVIREARCPVMTVKAPERR